MQKTQSKILTEAALVAELQACGYADINERKVANWRRGDLLPELDRKGQGLGRGAGRQPGVWMDGESVVERAAWVANLLRVYGQGEGAYLRLWMLGYLVPLKRVKKALKHPFDVIRKSIRKEMTEKEDLGFEGFIDESVDEACRNARKGGIKGFQVSPVLMGVFSNLFFNREYNLEDEHEPFGRTVKAFRLRQARRINRQPTPNDDNAVALFEHALFIKEHLSFDQITGALQDCTDDDLRVVARDLEIMREIVFHLGRMVKALFFAVPAEFTDGFADKWHALFTVGTMCVLADLSLRRRGHGNWIDRVLPDVLNRVRAECTESREAELKTSSAQFFASVQTATDELARKFKADAAQASARKGRPRKTATSEMAA